jgi:uncharacterized protein YbgA (DUF1722 family)
VLRAAGFGAQEATQIIGTALEFHQPHRLKLLRSHQTHQRRIQRMAVTQSAQVCQSIDKSFHFRRIRVVLRNVNCFMQFLPLENFWRAA